MQKWVDRHGTYKHVHDGSVGISQQDRRSTRKRIYAKCRLQQRISKEASSSSIQTSRCNRTHWIQVKPAYGRRELKTKKGCLFVSRMVCREHRAEAGRKIPVHTMRASTGKRISGVSDEGWDDSLFLLPLAAYRRGRSRRRWNVGSIWPMESIQLSRQRPIPLPIIPVMRVARSESGLLHNHARPSRQHVGATAGATH